MAATKTIHTLQYNPYSNREKKGYTLYTGYAPYVVGSFTGINFNPADGVNTELILNTVSDKADYLLVMDGNTIESRWFILDAARTRGGQYHLQLYRDVVYDNLPEVMSATAFIEKGWINDVSNPLIFNQEALPTNQRKIDERLLKDNTNTPWIVGYLSPKAGDHHEEESDPLVIDHKATNIVPISVTTQVYSNLTQGQLVLNQLALGDVTISCNKVNCSKYHDVAFTIKDFDVSPSTASVTVTKTKSQSTSQCTVNAEDGVQYATNIVHSALYNTFIAMHDWVTPLNTWWHNHYTNVDIARYKSLYNNKYIIHNNKVYYIKMTDFIEPISVTGHILPTQEQFICDWINTYATSTYPSPLTSIDLEYSIVKWGVNVEVTPYSQIDMTTTLPADSIRPILKGQPYNMFCMPYGNYVLTHFDEAGEEAGYRLALDGETSMAFANAISDKFSGSGALYDLQLVPYCPIRDKFDNNVSGFDYTKFSLGEINIIRTNDADHTPVGAIFWCTTDSFNFIIQRNQNVGTNLEKFKVKSQTLKHRLCAPNFSSSYEYSPNKVIEPQAGIMPIVYEVRCTYKPYSPFIYVGVNSQSSSLYGLQYYDGRGLICSGNFSLPQTSDAWETYQILNKNYSNIFNREVQSIELSLNIARARENWQMGKSAITGASNTVGNILTGNFIGAASSAIGMSGLLMDQALNQSWNDKLRADQLDLKQDLYLYNLENIQALPNTLLNVSSYDILNKVFPFLEVYDCTETETSALLNKIKYNGMSIGVISEGLSLYLIDSPSERSFIKGLIIRIDLHDDYHMLKTIKEELEIGFFINKGGS